MAEFKTPADAKMMTDPHKRPLTTELGATNTLNPRFRSVWYVQVHDTFNPLQMSPLSSLSMIGHNPMLEMTERPQGIYVRCMGKRPGKTEMVEREFMVPYGNVSHYEYVTEK